MDKQNQQINIPESNQEKPKNFWQRLKMWQKTGIIFSILLLTYVVIIPLLFCTNVDFDFSQNPEYVSCSQDSDCIAKSCGCLNEKGAKKFSLWTAFCGMRLACLIPSFCICQDEKCVSNYDYENDIAEEVNLTTDKIGYQTGETTKVNIKNNFDFPIYYEDPCCGFLDILKYDGNNWVRVNEYDPCDCVLAIEKLKSDQDKTFQLTPEMYDFPDGNQRYKALMYYSLSAISSDITSLYQAKDQMIEVYSNEFTIGKIQEVSLTTNKAEYQTGEEVKLTVKNNLDEEITFGIISLEVETDKWEEALSEEDEIIIDNVFDEFVKDIYCDCNAECKKLPLSIKLNSSEEYIWDQKIGLCSELPLNKKLRFKIKSRNSGYINYSNEFIIKGDSAEIRGFDYCQEDSDCEARFSHCDCRYLCINKLDNIESCKTNCFTDMGAIPECVCEDNMCVDKKFLSYTSGNAENIIQDLIQQMGDDNVSQEAKYAIPEKLYDYGKEAIPYLTEALDDEMVFDACHVGPSGMLRLLGDECNQRLVNSECMTVIKRIITPSPSPKVALTDKVYRFYYQVDNWQQWWNENQDKSLNEIRKMVRDWYRIEEEKNNYSGVGYRGEEYDYLDIVGDLEHDDFLLKLEEVCTGFDNLKQVDYLEWPISCGCLTTHKHDCYQHFAEHNKDASVCDEIIWNAGARDNCYWAVAVELNKAGMNDKIDFCGKIEDVGIENHARQKACFKLDE